jgi:hypothetical protein
MYKYLNMPDLRIRCLKVFYLLLGCVHLTVPWKNMMTLAGGREARNGSCYDPQFRKCSIHDWTD